VSEPVLHPEATADIKDIWKYIATKSLDAADRFREEIFKILYSIEAFPNRGHIRPDLTTKPLRFHVVREYLIAYAPDEKPLVVIAVLHGRRNPLVISAILRGRA
jgi:plasmid stabilization system protein ParE